jgi:hypothetical protein
MRPKSDEDCSGNQELSHLNPCPSLGDLFAAEAPRWLYEVVDPTEQLHLGKAVACRIVRQM